MNNQTKKFFIYTRKSTDDKDRQVRSISDQLAELKSLALKEQLDVVDVFVEKQTAKIPGRPVFNEMIERMEKAKRLVFWRGIPIDLREIALMVEKLFILLILA
jgi:DNA invertase Pin-like site-specific DNA recombinase